MSYGEDEKPREPSFLETVRELQHKDPYSPFYVITTSGDRYLIEHPNLFVVGETQMYYCFPHSDKWVFIRNNQIVALENYEGKKSA